MESILKWLFSSDLCIGREEKEERNLAKENAAVMDAAENYQRVCHQNCNWRGVIIRIRLNGFKIWNGKMNLREALLLPSSYVGANKQG